MTRSHLRSCFTDPMSKPDNTERSEEMSAFLEWNGTFPREDETTEYCDICGPVAERVELFDVGDTEMLLCPGCADRVPTRSIERRFD